MSGEILIGFREDTDTGKNIRGVSYDYPMPTDDPLLRAARGNGDVEASNVSGFNSDIDATTDPETVWSAGGVFVKQTAAETVNLVSNSASDAAAGTGARTVLVTYLDEDYIEQSAIVVMAGLSNSPLPTTCIAINRMEVITTGTLKWNAGTINAVGASSGDIHSQIPRVTDEGNTIGSSISQQMVYTVPAGKGVMIDALSANFVKTAAGAVPKVALRGFYESPTNVKSLVLHEVVDAAITNEQAWPFPTSRVIPEKYTLTLEALTDKDNTYVGARAWFRQFPV